MTTIDSIISPDFNFEIKKELHNTLRQSYKNKKESLDQGQTIYGKSFVSHKKYNSRENVPESIRLGNLKLKEA
jgi:hypothetical protein